MSKRTIIIAAAGVLVVGGAIVAVSAPGDRGGWRGGHHGHGMMSGDDGGHDMRGRFGRPLTKDAYGTRMRERFAGLDKNSDGTIDTAELEAAVNERMASRHERRQMGQGEMGERMLRRFGAGTDGKLTKEKFRAEITSRFAEMDLNNDGRIDDSDLPPMMRGRNVLSEGGSRGGPMLRWMHRLDVKPKDGAILRQDVLAAADREFDRLDRNKDGTVDKADTDVMRKEMVDYGVKRTAHRLGAGPDGRLTREQFQAKAAERFARMDLDGDGTIARDERHGGWGHRGGGRHGGWGRDGGDDGMMGPGHRRGGMGGPGGDAGAPPAPGGGPGPKN